MRRKGFMFTFESGEEMEEDGSHMQLERGLSVYHVFDIFVCAI